MIKKQLKKALEKDDYEEYSRVKNILITKKGEDYFNRVINDLTTPKNGGGFKTRPKIKGSTVHSQEKIKR